MRRFRHLIAIAAAVLAVLPLGSAAMAGDHGWERGEHGRGGERGGGPPGWSHGDRGERGPPPGWERGERGGRQPMPPPGYYRAGPRGYYPPPPMAYGGYLRRGGHLPPGVRGEVVPDLGRYRLRPPPPGYDWVRVGNAFLLMNRETGQIFDMIAD
jgi:Ni/Co efflux regulator RcnB